MNTSINRRVKWRDETWTAHVLPVIRTVIYVDFRAHDTFLFFPTNARWVGEGKERPFWRDLRFYSHAHSYIFIYAICKVSFQDRISLYRYACQFATHWFDTSSTLDFIYYTSSTMPSAYIFVTYIYMYVLYVGHGVRTHTDRTNIFTYIVLGDWRKACRSISLLKYILRCDMLPIFQKSSLRIVKVLYPRLYSL